MKNFLGFIEMDFARNVAFRRYERLLASILMGTRAKQEMRVGDSRSNFTVAL